MIVLAGASGILRLPFSLGSLRISMAFRRVVKGIGATGHIGQGRYLYFTSI
jgi:hypothetical protein